MNPDSTDEKKNPWDEFHAVRLDQPSESRWGTAFASVFLVLMAAGLGGIGGVFLPYLLSFHARIAGSLAVQNESVEFARWRFLGGAAICGLLTLGFVVKTSRANRTRDKM